MFEIIFYKMTCEKNRIDKTQFLTEPKTYSGTLRESSSIINPSITIEEPTSALVGYNYCYIAAWNRYYFITDIVSVTNSLWEISMRVDVLNTFKTEIKQQKGLIARSSFGNKYLIDDKATFNAEYKLIRMRSAYIEQYPTSEDDCNVVLRVASLTSGTSAQYDYFSPRFLSFDGQNSAVSEFDMTNISTFLCRAKDIESIFNKMRGDSANAAYIISCISFPFKLCGYNDEAVEGAVKRGITIGEYRTEVLGWQLSAKSINKLFTQTSVSFSKNEFLEAEVPFYPYQYMDIYLPYYGVYRFNPNTLLALGNAADQLEVVYVLDPTSTTGLICITAVKNFPFGDQDPQERGYYILDTLNVEIGYNVDFMVTNKDAIERQRSADNISLVASAIGSLASVGVGAATAIVNPLGLASSVFGLSNLAGAVGKYGANRALEAEIPVTKQAGNSLVMGQYAPLMIMELFRKDYLTNRDEDYISQFGLPDYDVRDFSTLANYVEIGEVHLENIPNALDAELTEIETLLKSGVHF